MKPTGATAFSSRRSVDVERKFGHSKGKRIMVNKICVIMKILVICFCLNVFVYGQVDNVIRAKEMWEKVIVAKGGREKLQSVTSLVVSTKSHSPYDKKEFSNSHYEELFALPKKQWWYMDERPGFERTIRQCDFGQEICYESSFEKSGKLRIRTDRPAKTQEVSKRPGEINYDNTVFNNNYKDKFFERQLLYLMETKWFQPNVTGLRTEKIRGQKCPIIAVSLGLAKYEYVIDPKTFLPIQFVLWYRSEGKNDFTLLDNQFLEDYIEVAGIKFPQAIKRAKKTDTKTLYQVNVEYKAGLFDEPPGSVDGPDSWKPRKD